MGKSIRGDATGVDLLKYKGYIKPFPKHPKVLEALECVVSEGAKKVWLTGSFLKGDWATEERPKEFMELRAKIKRKTGYSDVDFVVWPDINSGCADILPEARQKVLIYDNQDGEI